MFIFYFYQYVFKKLIITFCNPQGRKLLNNQIRFSSNLSFLMAACTPTILTHSLPILCIICAYFGFQKPVFPIRLHILNSSSTPILPYLLTVNKSTLTGSDRPFSVQIQVKTNTSMEEDDHVGQTCKIVKKFSTTFVFRTEVVATNNYIHVDRNTH